MNPVKQIGLTFIRLVKEIWLLPQTISAALKQRQQRALLHTLETERLDRIRHPSKYRGK
jgi:hypothetical protein